MKNIKKISLLAVILSTVLFGNAFAEFEYIKLDKTGTKLEFRLDSGDKSNGMLHAWYGTDVNLINKEVDGFVKKGNYKYELSISNSLKKDEIYFVKIVGDDEEKVVAFSEGNNNGDYLYQKDKINEDIKLSLETMEGDNDRVRIRIIANEENSTNRFEIKGLYIRFGLNQNNMEYINKIVDEKYHYYIDSSYDIALLEPGKKYYAQAFMVDKSGKEFIKTDIVSFKTKLLSTKCSSKFIPESSKLYISDNDAWKVAKEIIKNDRYVRDNYCKDSVFIWTYKDRVIKQKISEIVDDSRVSEMYSARGDNVSNLVIKRDKYSNPIISFVLETDLNGKATINFILKKDPEDGKIKVNNIDYDIKKYYNGGEIRDVKVGKTFYKNGKQITHTQDCQNFFHDSHMIGTPGKIKGTSTCSCESNYKLNSTGNKCIRKDGTWTSTPSSDADNSNISKDKLKGQRCSSDLIMTQNLRAPRWGYIKNGKYDWYTKGTVKEADILQKHLNRLGFNAGKVDGIIGPKTRGAILRLQRYLGTKPDGYVGPKTRALLNNSCDDGYLQDFQDEKKINNYDDSKYIYVNGERILRSKYQRKEEDVRKDKKTIDLGCFNAKGSKVCMKCKILKEGDSRYIVSRNSHLNASLKIKKANGGVSYGEDLLDLQSTSQDKVKMYLGMKLNEERECSLDVYNKRGNITEKVVTNIKLTSIKVNIDDDQIKVNSVSCSGYTCELKLNSNNFDKKEYHLVAKRNGELVSIWKFINDSRLSLNKNKIKIEMNAGPFIGGTEFYLERLNKYGTILGKSNSVYFIQNNNCSLKYSPVCGIKNGYKKTYSNNCFLEKDKAQFLNNGKCQDGLVRMCLGFPDPKTFCKENQKIYIKGKRANGCAIYACKPKNDIMTSWNKKLKWPIKCTLGEDCSIGYPDIDNDGVAANCGLPGYKGHEGTDIGISFDQMDKGVDVYAAMDGKVLWVFDGKYDRCEYPNSRNKDCQDPMSESAPNSSDGYRVCTDLGKYSETLNNEDAFWCFDGGNVVVIRHNDGQVFATRYDHLKKNSILVRKGDYVRAGQKIAEVGSAGRSTGPHLHFEVWGKTFYDPVDPWSGKCSK